MGWLEACLLGAAGGAIVEVVSLWGYLTAWQQDRRRVRAETPARKNRRLPPLSDYVDPAADLLVALTRLGIGALAGFLLKDQITGALAAIAVGAAGPAFLRQLGTTRVVQQAAANGQFDVLPMESLAELGQAAPPSRPRPTARRRTVEEVVE
ncbi:hypothetical protein [Acrocarpospora corrugata]|uniref:hypothetical protein n=1 Tax=Acrocarpospora corrugata TaxID=35763 RepID=UPI0012D2D032|nr:hypothetical protein [Acrocarpospora corrugata]